MTRRQGQLAFFFLILFIGTWDLRAVFSDRRLGPTDTTVEEAILLTTAVAEPGFSGLSTWYREIRKGPLAAALVSLLDLLVNEPLLAGRLLSVFLLWAVLGLVYVITLCLTGSRVASLLASVVCGTFPMVYGWFRLDYHEPLVGFFLLCGLWMMMDGRLSRSRALLLGVVMGLGILSKLAFPLFLMAPLLYYGLARVRTLSHAGRLGLSALVALVLAGWWVLPNLGDILQYMVHSQQRESETWQLRLRIYTMGIPGSRYLLLCAGLGALLGWWRRTTSGFPLALLCASILGGTAALVFFFDSWPRYMVPCFPLACVLCGVGIHRLAVFAAPRVPAAALKGLAVMGAAILLGNYCRDNIRGIFQSKVLRREGGLGMVIPDQRPYRAYPAAVALAHSFGKAAFEVPGWPEMMNYRPVAQSLIWERRGVKLPRAGLDAILESFALGAPVYVVFCHRQGDVWSQLSRASPFDFLEPPMLSAIAPRKKDLLRTFIDPEDVRFSVIRVHP